MQTVALTPHPLQNTSLSCRTGRVNPGPPLPATVPGHQESGRLLLHLIERVPQQEPHSAKNSSLWSLTLQSGGASLCASEGWSIAEGTQPGRELPAGVAPMRAPSETVPP